MQRLLTCHGPSRLFFQRSAFVSSRQLSFVVSRGAPACCRRAVGPARARAPSSSSGVAMLPTQCLARQGATGSCLGENVRKHGNFLSREKVCPVSALTPAMPSADVGTSEPSRPLLLAVSRAAALPWALLMSPELTLVAALLCP